jgi:glycosyltransferase involved in cell wall biosynthesis
MTTLEGDKPLLFSVIIPVYNYGKTLGRAIDSVLEQEGNDFEILIIDDGSTDDTSLVGKSYCDRFPKNITYYLQENQGPAAARNKGASVSRGEYLFFLDADDEMARGILKTLRDHIIVYGRVDLLVGDHISIDTSGRSTYSATTTLPKTREQCFSAYLNKKLNLSHCAKLLHRSVFEHVTYPVKLRSSEDIPFVAQILALYDCVLLSEPMAIVHKHDDSLRHNVTYAKQAGEKVVDYVFRYDLLPPWAKKYEKEYRARRCLSVFRTLYLSGNKKESLIFFKKALRLSPLLALKLGYLKKVVRASWGP